LPSGRLAPPDRRAASLEGGAAAAAVRPIATGDSFVLISSAYAQASGAASQSDTLLTFLPMIAIFVVFYFLLIRPQQKKQKEARAMLDALEKGNEVVTAGGILGRIVKLDEQYVTVEVAPNTQMVVQRGAISQLLPKGTIKAL
jgi:preprotein translocase subunit YajC